MTDPLTPEQQAMVDANVGLVWDYVLKLTFLRPDERDDMIQEGILGLMQAVRRHRPERGKLSTIAILDIRQKVCRAVRQRGVVSLPMNEVKSHLADAEYKARSARSLSALFHLSAPEPATSDENLTAALARLPAFDRGLLHQRFWEGWTYPVIGREHGRSHEWASAKVSEALERLRREYLRLEGEAA